MNTQKKISSDPLISFKETALFVYSYYKRFPIKVFFAFFAMTINIGAELLNPIAVSWLVDYVTKNGPSYETFKGGLFYVLIMVFQGVLFHVSVRTAHLLNCYTDSEVEKLVAEEAFNKVQHFSADWHTNAFAGSIVTKIKRSTRAIHRFYDTFCYEIYTTIGVAIGLLIASSLRSPLLGVIFGIFGVVYTGASIYFNSKYITPANRTANTHDTLIGAALADSISSNTTVKSFAGEIKEMFRFSKVASAWAAASRDAWIKGNIITLIQNVSINGLKLIIMTTALWLWYRGEFNAGDIVFVFGGYSLIMGYIRGIGDRIVDINQAVSDMEDVIIFHKTPLGVEDTKEAQPLQVVQGEIRFNNIHFKYPNQLHPVFKNFSLTIPPKQKVALVGYSGSGKSTFVKLLQRLYEVQDGSISIDGQNISAVTQESLRKSIALVPQDPILFHRSLAENIAYGKENASEEEIIHAAKLAHTHEFISGFQHKYQTLVGERGIKLSGGERQRVAIARAILASTPILILDEATSSLDSESEKFIQDALHNLIQGKTAIIVAHRLSTIREVDRILVFDKGTIIEDGNFEELLEKKGVFAKLWRLQRLE